MVIILGTYEVQRLLTLASVVRARMGARKPRQTNHVGSLSTSASPDTSYKTEADQRRAMGAALLETF